MNKNFTYKTIAVIGAILLIINVFFIAHQTQLSHFSKFIELIVLPLTIIATSFAFSSKAILVGVALYFFSFPLDIMIEFNIVSDTILENTNKTIFFYKGIAGIFLVSVIPVAIHNKQFTKYRLFKSLNRSEFSTLTTIITAFSLGFVVILIVP